MFSSRTNWNTSPNNLSRLLKKKRARGVSVLDLTESNPTRCGFHYEMASIPEALADTRGNEYDPDPRGLHPARLSVCEYYEGLGQSLNPENIFLTSSTSEAYSFIFRLLCNPGDRFLAAVPSYPLLDDLCRINDVELASYRLAYDGEWHIDFDSLTNQITPSTHGLILIHPNNPTGSFIKETERLRIIEIARRHNLSLVVDEVFSSYPFSRDDKRAGTFAGVSEVLTFSLNGVSKLLGLPQMKLSWLTVSGPAAARTEAMNRLELLSDTYLSVSTVLQMALPHLMQSSSLIRKQIQFRTAANRDVLAGLLNRGSVVSTFNSEGGWYAILQLPGTKTDEAWACDLLEDHNVLVHPGHFFAMEQESCLVISLLPEQDVFKGGVETLLTHAGS